MPKVLCIVGKSGSGKTTLIERLIPELMRRGYRIGTLKHAFHAVEMDQPGKDSWRHRHAGAEVVVVASGESVVMIRKQPEADIDRLMPYFSDMDLVIAEGFKKESKAKIEVIRSSLNEPPLCLDDDQLAAVVTDVSIHLPIPVFGLDDIEQVSDFVEKKFIRESSGNARRPPVRVSHHGS